MKRKRRAIEMISGLSFAAALFTLLPFYSAEGSAKFTKETGKKCLECHSKIPKKGENELYLTEYGKKFKENGNKAPENSK